MIRFTKMHGLGNDFVVIDAINQSVELTAEKIQTLSDRNFGIGFDQLLLVETARDKNTDFYYRIYNADGGEVEQCGNGARCFMRFVHDKGLSDKNPIIVGTQKGNISLTLDASSDVTVAMGIPSVKQIDINAEFTVKNSDVYFVDMGNPHIVFIVDDLASAPVEDIGESMQLHKDFPTGVNVGFVQVEDKNILSLRVYERGAEETLACGSGACAAVVAARTQGLIEPSVTVHLEGGDLQITWNDADVTVMMTGPAVSVFDGEKDI